MADFTSDDVNSLRETLASLNQTMVNLGNTSKPTRSTYAPSRAEKDQASLLAKTNGAVKHLGDATAKAAKQAENLDSEFRSLNTGFANLKKLLTFSAPLAVLSTAIGTSINQYRELASAGQTFGGSMLKMQIAAAEARVPLEEFTKMIKDSSTIIAATGITAFSALNRSLRDNLAQFGQLNMTTEELTSYMQEYMTTQQSWGILNRLDSARASESMKLLAIETTKVANLTGVNRSAISKATQQALQDDSLRSKMFMMQGNASEALVNSLGKATTYLAGMPGEAGTMLSSMLAQSVGRGSAMLTDQMQDFVNAGMFGVTDLVDNLKRKVSAGTVSDADMDNFRKNFVQMGRQNMAHLKYMADHANDPAAKRMIGMITSMGNLDGKKIKELEAQTKATNFFMNLQKVLKDTTGFIRERFYKTIGNVSDRMDTFFNSPAFKEFQNRMGALGDRFGNWLASKFTEENLQKLSDSVNSVVEFGIKLGNITAGTIAQLAPVVDLMVSGFSKLSDLVGGPVMAGLTLMAGFMVAKFAAGKIKDGMTEKFSFLQDKNAISSYRHVSGAMKVWVMNSDRSLGSNTNRRGGATRGATRTGGILGRTGTKMGSTTGKVAGKSPIRAGVGRLAGGLGGAAMTAGMMALNSGGKFKGQGTLNVLGGAASGAMMGSMFGPIGTALGGIMGGAYSAIEHWEDLTSDVSSLYKSVASTASDLWGASVSGMKGAYEWVIDSATAGINAVKTMVTDIFSKLGAWFGDMFSWIGDFFSSDSVLSKIVAATPIGAAVMAATRSTSGVTSRMSGTTPSVDTDALQNQVTTMRQQQQQILKENADLKAKLAQLMDLMTESVAVQRSGLSGIIEETKKGNRDLGSMARGGI